MSTVRVTEFKGHKVLEITNGEDDKWPFRFGLKKAKMIMEHLDKIEEFAESEGL